MDLRRITDFDAPELDVYARLTDNQLLNRADPQNALFVAESPLVIGRALDAGCEPVSFLMETKHVTGKGAALLARCPGVPVYAAEEDVLTNLTGFHLTRGMLCAMRRPPLADPAAVLRPSPDEVQDTFTAPLSWLAAHPPAIYRYPLRPEIGPDFPYDRVGASAGYSWQAGRMEVPVYEGLPYPLWGLTARITWWLLEQYGNILTNVI